MSAKEALKDLRDRYPTLNIHELRQTVEGFEHVSFDLFDTLLKRDVGRPSDIFALVGRALCREDSRFDAEAYVRARQWAEVRARENASKEGRREVTHREIIAALEPPFADLGGRLAELEVELELACCTPNRPLVDLFRELRGRGKRVYVTSNIYLPEPAIRLVLRQIGCSDFSGLYLSNEHDAIKQDGSLFQVLLREQDLRPHELIHIGDSHRVDVRGARAAQVSAVQVPRLVPAARWRRASSLDTRQRVDHRALVAFLDHRIDPEWGSDYAFGYEALGPLLYGFTRWLHAGLVERNIRKVFFFSRDGYILREAYRRMYSTDESIATSYLYVSRRALRVPQLWLNPDLPAVVDSFPVVQLMTMRAFLSNMGLDPGKYEDVLHRYGWTLDHTTRKDSIVGNSKFESLYAEIQSDVDSVSREEHAVLMDYLSQEGFSGETGVVDIGWFGSLQYFLEQAIRADTLMDARSAGTVAKGCGSDRPSLHGFYVGLGKGKRPDINSQGFIVDPGAEGTTDSWRGFSGLIEYLFLAQEGSTRRLRRSPDGQIVAELYDYEYAPDDPEVAKVKNIQRGALRFIEDFHRSGVSRLIGNDSRVLFAPLIEAGNRPARASLELFGDVRFVEEAPVSLARPSGWMRYLAKPAQLRQDFYYSKWKVGFLKRLFRLPLPYQRVYGFMKKIER